MFQVKLAQGGAVCSAVRRQQYLGRCRGPMACNWVLTGQVCIYTSAPSVEVCDQALRGGGCDVAPASAALRWEPSTMAFVLVCPKVELGCTICTATLLRSAVTSFNFRALTCGYPFVLIPRIHIPSWPIYSNISIPMPLPSLQRPIPAPAPVPPRTHLRKCLLVRIPRQGG